MRTLPLLLLGLSLSATACSDAPAPAPATTTPKAVKSTTIIADEALPKALRATLTEPPAQRLDLSIAADGVYVDEGPLFDATPPARRAQAWPAGRPSPTKVAPLSAFAMDDAGRARLQSTLAGSRARGAGAADLQVMALATAPYSTVLAVLGQARASGYKRWWVRARGRKATGTFRVRRARWCSEGISAPTPCTITHALITDTTTYLQNRSHAEAACGVPPAPAPARPASLFIGPRGPCKNLRHQGKQVAAAIVPPHRTRSIKGKRCGHGTVAAWPTARWTQVVEIADGLRAAGHEMIALSAAEEGETCTADPAAPPSAASPSAASTAPRSAP